MASYRYDQVASGNSTDLQKIVQAEERYIPEGGLAELKIDFRLRFPGFENLAQETRNILSRVGVVPWPDEWRTVFVDPDQPIWYIRWKKGNPWAGAVTAALIVVTVAIVSWTLFHVFKPTLDVITGNYPWLIPIIIVGGFVIYFQQQSKKESAEENYGRYG